MHVHVYVWLRTCVYACDCVCVLLCLLRRWALTFPCMYVCVNVYMCTHACAPIGTCLVLSLSAYNKAESSVSHGLDARSIRHDCEPAYGSGLERAATHCASVGFSSLRCLSRNRCEGGTFLLVA